MDIQKILTHSIELLELRGEDVESFKTKLQEIDKNRFYNEVLNLAELARAWSASQWSRASTAVRIAFSLR